MCFDLDSRPPIAPIAGGALDHEDLVLTSADGNHFAAFRVRAAQPIAAGIIVLPDVRGLYHFYEELALRFAESGIDAIAIDYFGRTAGVGKRGAGFEYLPHVGQTTWGGLSGDIRAAAAELSSAEGHPIRALFAVGFCFGGRVAFLSAAVGLDLAGVIGFYGVPVGPARNGMPAPVDVAAAMHGRILGLFGGADQGIPPSSVAAFDEALRDAGVDHELVTYPGAPHSFFDRKAAEFADASADAWRRTIEFIRSHTPAE